MKHVTCFREFRLALLLAPWMVLALILGVAISPAQAAVPSGPPTFSNPLDITNLYFPFQPGGLKVFNGLSDAVKTVVVDKYLTETRTFNWSGGVVECRVLEEVGFEGGKLVEISKNFFAQADDGTVYYFGEVVDIYDNETSLQEHGNRGTAKEDEIVPQSREAETFDLLLDFRPTGRIHPGDDPRKENSCPEDED